MYSLKSTSWSLRGAAVAIAVGLVAWGVLHYRSRVSAVSSGEEKQLQKEAPALKDSLVAAEHRSVIVTDTIHKRLVVYDSLRKNVVITDTSRFVVVDTQFVHIADSVAKSCSELTINCAQARAAAAKVIANQAGQIQVLSDQLSHQPGKLQRFLDIMAGSAAGYGVCKLTK